MATNSEIAKAAGVSPAVVSRIVNGDESLRVSEEKRARVLQVIKEMGYEPNVAARSLRSAQSGVLALVVHDITNPVYAEIIAGAQRAAADNGKALVIGEAADLGGSKSRIGDLIGGGGVDGLILQGAGTEMDRALERAARRSVPTVMLQSGEAENGILVCMDDERAGYIATEHLLNLGHRRIGFLGTSESLRFSTSRMAGWERALHSNGVVRQSRWSGFAGNTYSEGARGIECLLEAASDITSVVVANVVSAIGVLASLHDRQLKVPDEFSVIAIHDAKLVTYLRPALTVVSLPLREFGKAAVEAVCAETSKGFKQILVNEPAPELVLRSTTATPNGSS